MPENQVGIVTSSRIMLCYYNQFCDVNICFTYSLTDNVYSVITVSMADTKLWCHCNFTITPSGWRIRPSDLDLWPLSVNLAPRVTHAPRGISAPHSSFLWIFVIELKRKDRDQLHACISLLVYRSVFSHHEGLGQPNEWGSEMDRSRRRHWPDVDRVFEHGDGRQQGPDAGQQRAHPSDADDATAVWDQSSQDGHSRYCLSCWHSLHQPGRPRLESVSDTAYST